MSKQHWYSATLRFAYVNSVHGKVLRDDGVFLVRATSFRQAFEKFLDVGRKNERTFKSEDRNDVAVRLAEIVTMDQISSDDLDGVEVSSQMSEDVDPTIKFDTIFNPASSQPEHTGI